MDKELLSILVCPLCKVSLEQVERGLFCKQCRRLYPLRDEIPVMFIEEATIIPEEPEESQ